MSDTLRGTVSHISRYSFRLAGSDDWLHVSQFANPSPRIPRPGQEVIVVLDHSGFVRSVEVVAPVPAPWVPGTGPDLPFEQAVIIGSVANLCAAKPGADGCKRNTRQSDPT